MNKDLLDEYIARLIDRYDVDDLYSHLRDQFDLSVEELIELFWEMIENNRELMNEVGINIELDDASDIDEDEE